MSTTGSMSTTRGYFKPMLAKVYDSETTVLRFPVAVQPKLDGLRLLWDGVECWSRTGKKSLAVPPRVLQTLRERFCDFPLDGELYAHGLGFEKISSLARNMSRGQDVSQLLYCVFDRPGAGTFAERCADLWVAEQDARRTLSDGVSFVVTARAADLMSLQALMERFISEGYEGCMIRDLSSLYEHKRTSSLLKWKRVRKERAVVTGVYAGEGKHEGRIGGLHVQQVCSLWYCDVGTGLSDEERERGAGWWIGREIEIGFQELSKYGVPRFPRLLSVIEEGK